jgi:hypothetical protein
MKPQEVSGRAQGGNAPGPLVARQAARALPKPERVVGVAGIIVVLGRFTGGVAALPCLRSAECPDVALHSTCHSSAAATKRDLGRTFSSSKRMIAPQSHSPGRKHLQDIQCMQCCNSLRRWCIPGHSGDMHCSSHQLWRLVMRLAGCQRPAL